jgi:ADP-heptose:LPS heptosyltransferase
MACLDLVISVDSSVAHLPGAIGKRCLMLSPYTRCWRWWSEETGWPWYNKMKLYHQEQSGSWDKPMREVIQQVKWMMK